MRHVLEASVGLRLCRHPYATLTPFILLFGQGTLLLIVLKYLALHAIRLERLYHGADARHAVRRQVVIALKCPGR